MSYIAGIKHGTLSSVLGLYGSNPEGGIIDPTMPTAPNVSWLRIDSTTIRFTFAGGADADSWAGFYRTPAGIGSYTEVALTVDQPYYDLTVATDADANFYVNATNTNGTVPSNVATGDASAVNNTWVDIPDPDWGTIGHPGTAAVPARPTEWASDTEIAGYYYVDFGAVDTGQTYGTPTTPRTSIPASVLTGSATVYRVELAGTCTDNITWSAKGTEANPIWIISDATNPFTQTPNGTSNRYFRVENGQYLIFEGLDFDGLDTQTSGAWGIATYTNTVADMTHHICLRNCAVHDYTYSSHSSAVTVSAGLTSSYPDAVTRDLVFYNVDMYNLGTWDNYSGDWDFHGINLLLVNRTNNEEIYNVWMIGGEYSYISGDSIQVNAERWGGPNEEYPYGREHIHHVYVVGTESHHNRQSGGAFKQCVDVVFAHNHVHDMPKPTGTVGTGVMWLYGPDRVWILNNHIHDCITGMRQSTTNTIAGWDATVYIAGNIVHDCFPDYVNGATNEFYGNNRFKTGQGIGLIHANEMRHIYYNTIYNCKGGISVQCDSSSGCDVQNNVVMNIDEDNVTSSNYDDAHISLLGTSDAARDYVGYNVVDDDQLAAGQFYLGSAIHSSVSTFETAAGARASNNVESDPLFTSPGTDDFTLQASSPARASAATDLTALNTSYLATFGVSLLYDYAENARTFDSGDDAGALEYQA